MVKARKYVVTKRFDGAPKRSDFEIVEYELPQLEDKEILIKTEWISVDPYLRAYHSSLKVPYDQFSFNIGVVQESKDPKYPVGTKVVTHKGWCDYAIAKENDIVPSSNPPETVYKVPDLKGLPESLAVGSVGMPGVSAYFGFLEICKPQPGETVVVSGAAGAVGTIVGQIAKIKGCKVIGFAGSDEKVNWLEKELGFDKAINYKTAAIDLALKEAAPEGVDCYYDNMGGDISTIVMSQMNEEGRVTICGCISVYNEDFNQLPKSNMLQPIILFKELKVQGFLVWKKFHRWNEGFSQLIEWISKGQLKPTEHVTEGFDNLFDAFVGMLTGENKGKAVVKI